MTHQRIVVVGGGIAGLTAAYHLAEARRAGAAVEEYLFEAGPRLGGVLRTDSVEGCLVEAGPDSFLTEKRDGVELCRQLGLGPELMGSSDDQRKTWIVHRGSLVPLPEGFEFLVPTRLLAVARTPLLSLRDKLALASEIFFSPPKPPGDETVASFVERHFSRGLVENIVEPLLTAVYGGDADTLSVQSVLPRYVEMEKKYGSLVRGVRRAARDRTRQVASRAGKGKERSPLFTTLRSGLRTLADALRSRLEEIRVVCGRPVNRITYAVGGANSRPFQVWFDNNESFEADALILALPAHGAARLLGELDKHLALVLAEIPYSSSVIVAAGYDASVGETLPPGFGLLVPGKERMRLRACTFVGQKFAHRVPPERTLLRCFLGGMKDEAVLELSDAEVAATVRRELRGILGISAEPLFLRVYRWPKAMAQYTVGHQERLQRIRTRMAAHPGLWLCGNAYEGIGIPDCIRSGRKAAEDCLHLLGSKQ
ncbi:MAG: protoporphyrinogen oxidase [Terriglobia bacterium]